MKEADHHNTRILAVCGTSTNSSGTIPWRALSSCLALLLVASQISVNMYESAGVLRVYRLMLLRATTTTTTTEEDPLTTGTRDSHTGDHHQDDMHTTHDEHEHEHPFQLSVPFYIYENELDWSHAVASDRQHPNNVSLPVGDSFLATWKHSDDWWFLHHAKSHPMRTRDPTQAKLFLVPTLLNALATKLKKAQLCVNGRCNRDLLDRANALLGASPYFQRYHGRDHIVVDSHWRRILQPHHHHRHNTDALANCSFVSFERSRHDEPLVQDGSRVALPSTYVGQPCPTASASPSPTNKTHDFAMVTSWQRGKTFLTRQKICEWLHTGSANNQTSIHTHNTTTTSSRTKTYTVSRCGPGPQCPALAQAKYGFTAEGDTMGANRPMDTLLSGTVVLFTHELQYQVLPDFLPWRNMSYFLPVSSWKEVHNITTQERFEADLQQLLRLPDDDYQKKRQTIAATRHLLDATQPYQLDLYLHQFALRLGLYNEVPLR